MKNILLSATILLIVLPLSTFAYDFPDDCGACGMRPACGSRCVYDTYCQCADIGVYYNPCIDRCTYCKVFGNIGAR